MRRWQLEARFNYTGYLSVVFGGGVMFSGEEAIVQCPDCSKEKLWIQIKARKVGGIVKFPGAWTCYYCSASGWGPFTLIQFLTGEIDRYKLYREVANYQYDQPTQHELSLLAEAVFQDPEFVRENDLVEIELPLSRPYRDWPSAMQQHMYKFKKLNKFIADQCNMRLVTEGFYQDRIVVPLEMDQKTVGFVARHTSPRPPEGVKKVLYPVGCHTSQILFNYDNAKARLESYDMPVIITEDVFSAAYLHFGGTLTTGRGSRVAVASLGTNLSSHQITRLMSLGMTEVILLWDRDATVRHVPSDAHCLKRSQGDPCPSCNRYEKTWKIVRALSQYWQVKVPILPDERDPDEYENIGELDALIWQTPYYKNSDWMEDARALVNRL